MTIAYLCLGSNTGDKLKLVQQAVSLLDLAENISIIRASAAYETEPWGVKNQDWFLNLVVEIKTSLTPEDLMFKCQEIELLLGRSRDNEIRWGKRPIDIDIIFYGKEVVFTNMLCIPHKLMHRRAFVLVPLMELIPDFIHPVICKSVEAIYDDLEDVEEVYLYGTRINE
jgi:2-amino-4-hydroxy-6-hydroxymethyldihydropteridine diphosphokinase